MSVAESEAAGNKAISSASGSVTPRCPVHGCAASTGYGKGCRCAVCHVEGAKYFHEYYVANRERIAERQRKYCAANQKVIAEYHRGYREANRERIAERDRKYYAANREVIGERVRKYAANNKEAIAEYRRKRYEGLKTAGLCARCGKREPMPDCVECWRCSIEGMIRQ